jgi:hypothetical protein
MPPLVPHDLDREVGPIPIDLADQVALVRFRPGVLRAALQGPAPEDSELDVALEAIRFDEAADQGLDPLVIAGRPHDLEISVEVRDPGRRPLAAEGELNLVAGPVHAAQDHALVRVGHVLAGANPWRRDHSAMIPVAP